MLELGLNGVSGKLHRRMAERAVLLKTFRLRFEVSENLRVMKHRRSRISYCHPNAKPSGRLLNGFALETRLLESRKDPQSEVSAASDVCIEWGCPLGWTQFAVRSKIIDRQELTLHLSSRPLFLEFVDAKS